MWNALVRASTPCLCVAPGAQRPALWCCRRDTVRHGADGFLFEPGSARSLGLRVAKLRADPRLRDEMGRAGRGKALAGLTPAAVARDYVDWYGRTIQRYAAGGLGTAGHEGFAAAGRRAVCANAGK